MINQIIRDNLGFVQALAIKYAPLPDVADDITQQVFTDFLKKEQQWDLNRDVRPLLAEMTRIQAKRSWQERCRHMNADMTALVEHVKMLAQDHEMDPILDREKEALRHCLQKLPDKSRHLIRARYYLKTDSVEMSRHLDMTPAAVRRALFRLRRKLRDCIQFHLKEAVQ